MRYFIGQPDKPDYLVCTNTSDYPPHSNFLASQAKTVIACDGAIAHCAKHGISPDMVIGDFDSCSSPDATMPCMLDQDQNSTDAEKALRYITDKSPINQPRVVVVGLGCGRFDHGLYHLKLLYEFTPAFASLDWLGAVDHCHLVDASCILQGRDGQRVSLFAPWGNAVVTLPNARYPVAGYRLSMDGNSSLSNAFIGDRFTLEIISGAVLVCADLSI